MTFEKQLEAIAAGERVTIILESEGPFDEPCAWCIPMRGAASATICEVACKGSTPMCAACLAMYDDRLEDRDVEVALNRCRPAVEAAAFPQSIPEAVAAGVARSVGRAALAIGGFLVGLVNAVGLYVLIGALVSR